MTQPIRVSLPYHLQKIAGVREEVTVTVPATPPLTLGAVLDALESAYPALRGTIRDHTTLKRRPFLRFFACSQDFSDIGHSGVLPPDVASGKEPLLVIGAIAGG